jgi:hypothetical protein
MKNPLWLLFLNTISLLAQQPVVTTNVITAHPTFRIVNGQLYNTSLSTNFFTLTGQCISILSNGVIVQRIEVARANQAVPTNAAQLTMALSDTSVEKIKTELVPGKKLFIRNYPDQPLAIIGHSIAARAMRDGVFSYGSEIIEQWDYGTPNTVTLVTTNGISTNAQKSGLKLP